MISLMFLNRDISNPDSNNNTHGLNNTVEYQNITFKMH